MNSNATVRVLTKVPVGPLRPFVRHFMVVEFTEACQDQHLPDTGFVATFRLDGECILNTTAKAPAVAFTGLGDAVRTHKHSKNNRNLIVAFTPIGVAGIVRESLDQFFNGTVNLEEVLPAQCRISDLREKVQEASDITTRIQIVERFLLSQTQEVDPTIQAAVARIESSRAQVTISDLASEVGLSQSALERRFRARIGTTPKKFASLVRLQHIVRLQKEGFGLSALAHEAGYFDQSHFIHDFRRFAGQSPESFFVAR